MPGELMINLYGAAKKKSNTKRLVRVLVGSFTQDDEDEPRARPTQI